MVSSVHSGSSNGTAAVGAACDDQAFIVASEIIHRVSLFISSSHLRLQPPDRTNAEENEQDTGSVNHMCANFDISNIVPRALPGTPTPAKALLVDQLRALVLSTRCSFDQNTDHKYKSEPGLALSSISKEPPSSSFQQTLVDLNLPATDGLTIPDSQDNKPFLAALLKKVKFQQNEIELQRATVAALEADLIKARTTISTITDSIQSNQRRFVDMDLLDRELSQSQMANKAFQTTLREIGEVVIAVAHGDLSKKVTMHAQEMDPEIIKFKETINTMMDQLQRFSKEVTRVATEVAGGTLGGQAEGEGTVGVWRELTDNVNVMASNLTNQVREIADVTRAVAQGDLSRKINVHAQGEILELQKTINTMVDQLRTFAFEVTRVARETGVEGRLGGQAQIDGVEGIWRELTDNGKSLGKWLVSLGWLTE